MNVPSTEPSITKAKHLLHFTGHAPVKLSPPSSAPPRALIILIPVKDSQSAGEPMRAREG